MSDELNGKEPYHSHGGFSQCGIFQPKGEAPKPSEPKPDDEKAKDGDGE